MSRKTTEEPKPPMGRHSSRGRYEKAKDARSALRRLLNYLLPFKKGFAIILTLVVLSTIFSVASPYFVGVAIDDYIRTGDITGLLDTLFLLLGIYIANWFCQVGQGWLVSTISQKALRKLRLDLFTHLQDLSLSFHDRQPSGELMSRLTNDIDAINQALSTNFVTLVASILSMGGILVTMLFINVWLALASLLVLPIQLIVTFFIGKKTFQGFRSLQGKLGALNSNIEETISGQKVITAFGQEEKTVLQFNRLNHEVRDVSIQALSYVYLINPVITVLGNVGIVAVASIGAVLAIRGLVTVGIIVAFISYARSLAEPLRRLGELYGSIQTALAGAERVFEIIDEKPEIVDMEKACPISKFKGIVVFDSVNFSYDPQVPVIKNMSLQAKPGQTIALVGPTGAGKTTIMNLLTRFYEIQNGSISIDGLDVRTIEKACLRRELGLVLQDIFLFTGTVLENIRYGKLDATDEECIGAATLANADQFIRRLPHGYKTMLIKGGSNLSQGQRQLITIARGIIADPSILILDEATSSVDTRTEIRLQDALLRLMKGRTSFVIAHRLSTIRNADQVLVIKKGEIVEQGTHYELLKKRGFYYTLYTSQFKGMNLKS